MGIRFIIAYVLNLFDLYCTMLLVNKYGIEIEGNPIGKFLLQTNLAIPVKTIGIGAAMFVLYACLKHNPQYHWTSWLVLAVYVALAIYHIVIFFIY